MRIARLHSPGTVFHLIWRFVDRDWFFTHEEEREAYFRFFAHALSESDWRCLAYALMSNHIHLAMIAGRRSLESWAKRVHSPFAQWMNRRHERLGPLMADRPKDFAITPEKVGSVIAYIHNNPVRAGVVDCARKSTWTSHRAYVGDMVTPAWLHVTEGLALTGVADAEAFDVWVRRTPGESGEVDLAPLQRTVRRRGAIELATPTKLDDGAHVPLVGRRFAHVRPDPKRVVDIAAELFSVSPLVLCSRRRNPIVVAARRVAVHSGRALGLTGSELASAMGVTPQAISKLARRPLEHGESVVYAMVLDRARSELVSFLG
jgi:REP element-mobilizing transposase RayT